MDDMRTIYCGNTCLVAKNNKFGQLYLHKTAKIIRGSFAKVAGSNSHPILIANDEVHIKFENFPRYPNITTDQYIKQDIISVINIVEH